MNARQSKSRTALVLAGGGLTGLSYEIGALHALDEVLEEFTVNDFDVYVGTSAGSVVSAFLANGIRPNRFLEAVSGNHPEARPFLREDMWRFNTGKMLRRSVSLPKRMVNAARKYAEDFSDATLFNLLWLFLDFLPASLYDSETLEAYMSELLLRLGGSDNFADLDKELHLIATQLNSGERKVFNRNTEPPVSISAAVAASSAVPVLYQPVRVDDVDYVDGGVRGNASLDVAIERGAELVLCINPLVPYDNTSHDTIPSIDGHDGEPLSETSMQAVVSQVMRTMLHSGLHYHAKQLRRAHPDVDILIIEPDTHDHRMSFNNIMRAAHRIEIAQHAYEAVSLHLAEAFGNYQAAFARQGIRLQRRLSYRTQSEARESENPSAVLRSILGTPLLAAANGHGADGERTPKATAVRLRRAINDLEAVLDSLELDGAPNGESA